MNRSAKMKSVDMATTPCFQHPDCNGTAVGERITKFFTPCGPDSRIMYRSENIALGEANPLLAINLWICETFVGGECVKDKEMDGHRRNIMAARARSLGNGYVAEGSRSTQNFINDICPTDLSTPVYDGSHFFTDAANQKIVYMSNYQSDTAGAPTFARIFLADTPHDLTLDLGKPDAGSYAYKPDTYVECQQYHYEFGTADGKTIRYPEFGYLFTVKDDSSACPSWSATKASSRKRNIFLPSWTKKITEYLMD
eukprot:gene9232-10830_t